MINQLNNSRHLSLSLIGIVLAIAIGGISSLIGAEPIMAWTLTIASLCAFWWVTEAVPIAITSLLPLAMFPLVGVLTPTQVAQAYGHPLILLLMGAFMLAQALEACGAHRRLALGMVKLVSSSRNDDYSPRRLVFGFMLAAASLSMWISNTATTLMLLPVMLALLQGVADKRLVVPLLLGTAYAASVGGLGTPIGTPPNLIFMGVYAETTGREPGFTEWMSWGMPTVIIMLPLMMLWLTRHLNTPVVITLPVVGRWTTAERSVVMVFILTAIAWMTRKGPFGGWSQWLDLPQANDASVAFLSVIILALLPDGSGKPGKRLLSWEQASRIPWGVLLLFAGGITLASGFAESGLTLLIGNKLQSFASWHPLLLIVSICICMTFLTEITSNTATTALLMPVLAAASIGAGIEPKLLMVPAVLSASCAFMLPVATAPNAVVYGSGQLTVKQMVKEGLVLNLIGIAVISLVVYFII